VKQRRSWICVLFAYHRVLGDLTAGDQDSVRSLRTRLFSWQCHIEPDFFPDNVIYFLWFVRLFAFACNIFELRGGLALIHEVNLYLFVHMRTCWGKCKAGAPENLVQTPSGKLFCHWRFKAVTNPVLFFGNYCGVLFGIIDHFINTCSPIVSTF
jgi:hypothetical protein